MKIFSVRSPYSSSIPSIPIILLAQKISQVSWLSLFGLLPTGPRTSNYHWLAPICECGTSVLKGTSWEPGVKNVWRNANSKLESGIHELRVLTYISSITPWIIQQKDPLKLTCSQWEAVSTFNCHFPPKNILFKRIPPNLPPSSIKEHSSSLFPKLT